MTRCNLCCIDVSFAARIIGAYTMSVTILLINVLVSNFFSRKEDGDFFESVKTWAILGLNWMQIIQKCTGVKYKAESALISFIIYAGLFLSASIFLTIGSLSKKHTAAAAVPWMYLQMCSVIDQAVSLSNHIIHDQRTTLYFWYTTVCSVYLMLSVYFWMVVEAARNQWYNEQIENANCGSIVLDTVSTTTSSNLKSPSFLSQNFSMFEQSRPSTILPI
ncbi:PREDICTED: uncharacterized protein LOC108777711 [Cyphomyrmex costatus]|uniref:Uncharacterized protein n=1 Tax=Cyphomyrmex costatus TaxID=456900 RepID=A0A151ID06_9HYME|nr:PREDICTED: uncharacterized protein LOC108777711 [Cyphomyrmex costatus]KYM98272.1 hypothetical protein ALC62_11037 [Cyphomyrmex costatus]